MRFLLPLLLLTFVGRAKGTTADVGIHLTLTSKTMLLTPDRHGDLPTRRYPAAPRPNPYAY